MRSGKVTDSTLQATLWICEAGGNCMLTSYDQKHSAQMDVESRARKSLGVISSPVNHVSFSSYLQPAFDLRQSLPGPIRGGVGGEVFLRLLNRYPSGGVLVDVGCGNGKFWSFVGDRFDLLCWF